MHHIAFLNIWPIFKIGLHSMTMHHLLNCVWPEKVCKVLKSHHEYSQVDWFNITVDKNSFIELFKYSNIKVLWIFFPLDVCYLLKIPYTTYTLCKACLQLSPGGQGFQNSISIHLFTSISDTHYQHS